MNKLKVPDKIKVIANYDIFHSKFVVCLVCLFVCFGFVFGFFLGGGTSL